MSSSPSVNTPSWKVRRDHVGISSELKVLKVPMCHGGDRHEHRHAEDQQNSAKSESAKKAKHSSLRPTRAECRYEISRELISM